MTEALFKRLALAKYLAIALLFLMPFVSVSCMGIKAVELSGSELALGTTKTLKDPISGKTKTEVLKPRWQASVALLAAVAGALASLALRERLLRLAVLVISAIGALCTLLLKTGLTREVPSNAGPIAFSMEFGYWAVLMLFAAGALAALLIPPGLSAWRAHRQPPPSANP